MSTVTKSKGSKAEIMYFHNQDYFLILLLFVFKTVQLNGGSGTGRESVGAVQQQYSITFGNKLFQM